MRGRETLVRGAQSGRYEDVGDKHRGGLGGLGRLHWGFGQGARVRMGVEDRAGRRSFAGLVRGRWEWDHKAKDGDGMERGGLRDGRANEELGRGACG